MTQERPHQPAPPEMAETKSAEPTEPGFGATDRAAPAGEAPEPEPSAAAPRHAPAALQTLRQAMRRARHDDAERMGAIADLGAARIARLELLEEALALLQAQIPEDVDLFDFGLMAGAHPRLFLDMIGFVEMGRDARTYRLVQDTRHGRKLLAESDSVPRMVESVTDYVARRLLERDKALAADGDDRAPRATFAPAVSAPPAGRAAEVARPRRRGLRVAGAAFAFLIDLLGVITFFTIAFAILFYAALQLWPKLSEQLPGWLGQG